MSLVFLAARYQALALTGQNPPRNRALELFAGYLLGALGECPPGPDSVVFTRGCVFAGHLLAGLQETSC